MSYVPSLVALSRSRAAGVVVAAFAGTFAASSSVLAIGTVRVHFGMDPTWMNTPLSQDAPSCKSTIDVSSPPGGNQFPDDSIVTHFTGNVRAQLVGGASTSALGGFLRRGTLTQQQAAGTGLPGGFSGWPNPGVPGELTGMMWPMRDFMNFGTGNTIIPGGFDNSELNGGPNPAPNAILNISGGQDVARYGRRSNIGNGVSSDMNLYLLEFVATDFTPRTIRVTFEPGTIEVTAPDGTVFRDITFLGGSTDIQIVPGPGAAGLFACAGAAALRRRRR